MSRKWGTLQKRLSELESELIEAYHFRLLPHSDDTQKISRRLQKRFAYITNLLSAEAASTPDKTHQFHEIGVKLAELEAVFRWWNEYPIAYAINNYLQDNHDADTDSASDSDSDSEGPDSPTEQFSGGREEGSGRIWGGFCKLCAAFGSGVVVGAVCCVGIINFSEYQDIIYDIHPT